MSHAAALRPSPSAGSAVRGRPRGQAAGLAALAAAILVFLAPAGALAQDISLSNLIIDNNGGNISVRFGLEFANPLAVEAAVNDGAELALICNARLIAKRDYWIDREIGRAETVSPVRKSASGLYSITTPGGTLTGNDFSDLLARAFEDFSMVLGPWNILSHGEAYSLSMEIRLERQNVSPWLKKSLFFWSFDAAPPARYRLDFSY